MIVFEILIPFMQWLASITPNYGVAIAVFVACYALVLIPLQIWRRVHANKKAAVRPFVQDIRAKYHYETMGMSTANDNTLPEEIRKMSINERNDAMANELRAVYKKHNFHSYLGWIPAVIEFVLVVWMYNAIVSACPEDSIFALAGRQFGFVESFSHPTVWIMIVLLVLTTCGMSAIATFRAARKTGTKDKQKLLVAFAPLVLAFGLTCFFGWQMTSGVALGATLLECVRSVITFAIDHRKAQSIDFSKIERKIQQSIA